MNNDSLVLRQVNPFWVQQGEITSQVFKPTAKDQGLLSAYDGDLISAEEAWQHFTGVLTLSLSGVVAVSVSECTDQGTAIVPDYFPYPEHVSIDFRGLESATIERVAKMLKAKAKARGWQHGPIES